MITVNFKMCAALKNCSTKFCDDDFRMNLYMFGYILNFIKEDLTKYSNCGGSIEPEVELVVKTRS
jgi:hypothetical protein